MARRKLYGQFHQPSHILRYYPIEMECFVPVSGEVATAANVIGASCGTSSSSSSTTGSNMIQANGPMQASGFGSDGSSDNSSSSGSSTGSSTGLGSVTGTLSGVTGGLQNGGSITTPLSGVNGG
jgi:hypothetical protein